ncbi:cysteine hydrolase family protein [Lysobacter capsici]|uniref:cysteine hydrolase family protein n=1 Tax=Lysobacter capsici TaxID=435897 RepID=UPI00287BC456|nr:isochorismatase family protein [Lysobacter capsici]WND79836.1 isochorismatase family protein [Lysobacter capsici]WND85032.1 isochorismatase family protein [Lysobacter capsici]
MRISALLGLATLSIAGIGAVDATTTTAEQHPTIRAIAGATPVSSLQASKTALLVIDFQNEYFAGGRMPIPDGDAALRQTRRLLEFADRHRIRVIHVQHVLPVGAPLFAEGGNTVKFHAAMQPRRGEPVIQKDSVSVFAGASADAIERTLKDADADTLIIAGLQTHACVAGAARDAAARGYRVIVASDASATRDLTLRDGSRVDHRQLHASALAEIEDTFGEVMSTDRIIALPVH